MLIYSRLHFAPGVDCILGFKKCHFVFYSQIIRIMFSCRGSAFFHWSWGKNARCSFLHNRAVQVADAITCKKGRVIIYLLGKEELRQQRHSLASQSCDDSPTCFPHSRQINGRFILHIDMLWNIMILFVLTYFQIPAAPVAQIDFSSAKSKKKKLDSSIDGKTTRNKVGKSLPVPCPRVKRGSETYASFLQH